MRRLGRLAEGLLEAGWLATGILLPLFIDKNGSEVFEPAKAGLLRAIALVMLAAWAVKALVLQAAPAERAAPSATLLARVMQTPLLLPVALVVSTALLATWLSVSPRDSFWGRADRAQGTLTLLAQVTIFAATAANLTSAPQLHRLVTALILPSVPIALYAVFQRLGLEPLLVTTRETEVQRVTSLLGQPVFLAAYLGMVMPFTVLRLVGGVRDHALLPRIRRAAIALYALVFALQCSAALLSESRGPLLGIAVAFAVGFLALAARHTWRRALMSVAAIGAAGAVVLALGLSMVLRDPSASSESTRIARRALEAFTVHGGGGQFRLTNWQIAERVLRNRTALEFADGSRDTHPSLRKWIGYGPESQYGISPPFYGPELPRTFDYFLTDRYHNDLWDTVVTTGVLGLVAWLALQSALLWHFFRALALLSTRMRARMFWLSYAGGAVVGALGWTAFDGLPVAFLGMQVGAVLGIAVFLTVLCFAGPRSRDTPTSQEEVQGAALPHEGLLVAALTAVVAHMVETSFSFTLVVTGALFWLCAALAVVCRRLPPTTMSARAADVAATQREDLSLAGPVVAGALLALAVMALSFAFLGGGKISSSSGQVLWDGLTLLSEPAGRRFPVAAIIMLVTLAAGTLTFSLEPSEPRTAPPLWQRARWTLGIASLVSLAYWMQLSVVLARRGVAPKSEALVVPRNLEHRLEALASFYVGGLLLLLLLATALASMRGGILAPRPVRWWRLIASACCTAVAAGLISPCVLRPATARAAVAVGDALLQQNKLVLAERAYVAATQSEVAADRHHARLAKAYARHARLDPQRADAWFQLANQAMIEAVTSNRLATENATNLAVVRGNWALHTSARAREDIASTVPPLYARALRLNPQDPTLWRLWATVQLSLLRDPEAAVRSALAAVERDPDAAQNQAVLGDSQSVRASMRKGAARRAEFLEAAASYARAIALAPGVPEYRVGEAKAYLRAGQPQRAVGAMRDVLARAPETSPARKAAAEVLRSAESALALVDPDQTQ